MPQINPQLVTPQLVSAAYKRTLRYGVFWRLRPEEEALLFLARSARPTDTTNKLRGTARAI